MSDDWEDHDSSADLLGDVVEEQRETISRLELRIAELERALDAYGDYSRHGDAIRRALRGNSVGTPPPATDPNDT